MGFAVASEAAARGAAVVLIAGPTPVDPPAGMQVVRVRTAQQMHRAVLEQAAGADVVVMAAAVADYAPVRAAEKIAKDNEELVLRLARTPDILADLGARRAAGGLGKALLVGFAAETGDVLARAREKRRRKQVDMIVANDVSGSDRGFEVDSNAVTIITADGETDVPLQSKAGVARAIVDAVVATLRGSQVARFEVAVDTRDQLAEHLKFLAELGVPGIARDKRLAARARRRAGSPVDRVAPSLPSSPRFRSSPVRPVLQFAEFCSRPPCDSRGDRRLHALQAPSASAAARLSSASATRTPTLMFAGEAPGRDEDIQGIPFVGRAGQLLTKMIEAIGMTRDDVYIANVIKCRPPENRNPEPDEVAACEPFLFRQVETIKPKVIVALGTFAAQTLLKTTDPISRLRGRVFNYGGAKLIPTFHPAYLLRSPERKRDAWEDLKKAQSLLRSRPERDAAPRHGAGLRAGVDPVSFLPMPRLVSVAVPVPALDAAHVPVPDGLDVPAVGARVLVPLGARRLTGIVLGARPGRRRGGESGIAVKDLIDILDAAPFLPRGVVELGEWVGDVLRVRARRGARRRDAAVRVGREPSGGCGSRQPGRPGSRGGRHRAAVSGTPFLLTSPAGRGRRCARLPIASSTRRDPAAHGRCR